jgi:hypothetical protein
MDIDTPERQDTKLYIPLPLGPDLSYFKHTPNAALVEFPLSMWTCVVVSPPLLECLFFPLVSGVEP